MGKLLNLLFYFGFVVSINLCYCEEVKYRLCGDENCNRKISLAIATMEYTADSQDKISFRARDRVNIYSKPKDPKDNLWEVEVDGKRGFAPQNFLKEIEMFVKKNDLIKVPSKPLKKEIKPSISGSINSSISETTESTTTAPLQDDPKNVVTTAAREDTSTEAPNSSPVLNDNIVDGTVVPADYSEENEVDVEIEDDQYEEQTTESSQEKTNEEIVDSGFQNNTKQNELSVEREDSKGSLQEKTTKDGNIETFLDSNTPDSKNSSEPQENIVEAKDSENKIIDQKNTENNQQNSTQTNIDNEAIEPSSDLKLNITKSASDNSPAPTKEKATENKENLGTIRKEPFSPYFLKKMESNAKNGDSKVLESETAPKERKMEAADNSADVINSVVEDHAKKNGEHKVHQSETQTIERKISDAGISANAIDSIVGDQEKPKIEENEKNETTVEVDNTKESVSETQPNESRKEVSSSYEDTMKYLDQGNHTNNGEQIDQPKEQEAPMSNEGVVQSKSDELVSKEVNEEGEKESNVGESIENNKLKKAETSKDEQDTDYKNTIKNDKTVELQKLEKDSPKGVNNQVDSEVSKPEPVLEMSSQLNNIENEETIIKTSSPQNPASNVSATQETQVNTSSKENSDSTISSDEGNVPVIEIPEKELSETTTDKNLNEEVGNREHVVEEQTPKYDKESHEDIREAVNSEIVKELNEDKITTEKVKSNWFFSNMFDAVNNFWSTISKHEHKEEENFDEDLDKILFPDKTSPKAEESTQQRSLPEDAFCEKLTPNSCPIEKSNSQQNVMLPHSHSENLSQTCSSEKDFFSSLSDKILEMVDLLACLLITAFTALFFCFGYYCICHSRKEGALLSKLNIVERSLLASTKETAILKHDLIETRNKLASIEDNSFGSNDMVVALRTELQESEDMKLRLQEQVASLEKELENAAEAGLELNKIVSELLNNQSGDDSIISSVEELQKQLNEQQNTILQINATLAEKSRENSELQLILTNQAAKFQEEIQNLKQQNDDLQNDKILLQSKIQESEKNLQMEISKAADEKRLEVQALYKEMSAFKEKYDVIYKKLQASDERVHVLEECLNGVKNNAKFNVKELIDAVNLKTEVMAIRRERDSLKERLEGEMDARKLLEDHVKIISEEVSNLKQEYNQSEKEKVEAQTRLEVLSSYFKEKETQLQKELSLKEAMWLKQQGETSSTVERVRLMQDELQGLKSQNDSLRAEIEAQAATHKAHIANLENRAHETWLTARQSERKLEEARTEATALRRKLTSMAGNLSLNETNSQNRLPNTVDGLSNDVNNVPSPVHMDSPNSPLLGGLPPPLPFLPPPPFMAAPHPFMPMPPPFMPPGEMRPPPLGRLMSPPPPPPHDRYSPSIVDERDRYLPPNGRYSPDNRYNYNTDIMSNYDTETDFSPPPSPGARSGGGNGGGYSSRERDRVRERGSRGYKPFSPPPPNNSDRNKKSKGILSSGSADSFDSRKSKGKGKV